MSGVVSDTDSDNVAGVALIPEVEQTECQMSGVVYYTDVRCGI